jgi:hypothetical protein
VVLAETEIGGALVDGSRAVRSVVHLAQVAHVFCPTLHLVDVVSRVESVAP